jgi:hypothetical protein
MKRAFVVALVGIAALAMACGGKSNLPNNGEKPISTVVQGQGGADPLPSIDVVSPKQGDTIKGTSVTFKVNVDDFKLVDKIGQTSRIGEGHILYTLDPTKPGDPDASSRVKETSDKEVTWINLTPGEHMMVARLVENNGALVEPEVLQRITVNVQ